ncbi:MAG: dephospho-CoA kinase [Alphaproteobacteria bacterium]
MKVIGLTGSIAMGKSTAARMCRRMGVPVHDADAAVHALMAPGGAAVARVCDRFDGVADGAGAVDRGRLGKAVFGQPAELKALEAILHPLVRQAETRFRAEQRRLGRARVMLDIPLLFETGGHNRVDQVIVISAPAWLQKARVLRRPGMTEERLKAILARQVPDHEKRRQADCVVTSGLGRAVTWRQLQVALFE